MPGRHRLGNLDGGCFGDLGFQLLSHLRSVTRKDGHLMAGSRDSNVPEPRIQQVGMHSGISVDENPFGGEPLRAVARYCVSVVEVPMSRSVEFDSVTVIAPRGNLPIGPDRIDHGKVAVGDAERFVGRRELAFRSADGITESQPV